MYRIIQTINRLNIGAIINIGLIILILFGGWYMGSKLGIIKGLNADIEKYETQIKQKDEQIALDNKMIKALDKKNIKLSKKINKLTGKYDGIKKGTSMDDAINKYRSK